MKHTTFELRADDGAKLFCQSWLPDGEVRAVVQIAHGMAEHSSRYERFATFLTERRYAVYADDHRGHGRTVSDADVGWAGPGGWEGIQRDLVQLGEHAGREHPGKERCLFAHSMGSFATMGVMLRSDPYQAYVLSGSDEPGGALAALGKGLARIERLRLGGRGKSALLTQMSFGSFNDAFKPARTEFDWLSRDAAEVDAYVADPRCGHMMTTQFWVDFVDGLVATGRADWSRMPTKRPIYVFSGENDPVGKMGKGVRALTSRLRRAGFDRLEEKLWPGGRHEMLNEINRDEVMAAVGAFLDRALK